MVLSRGSAFYDAVEYIRLEANGYVSIHDPDKRKPIYACLQNEDWIRIRNLVDSNRASTWKSSYIASEIPSDGATHIVIEFSDLSVNTYNRMDSAPKDLGIDLVYDGIRSVAMRRSQEAEQDGGGQPATRPESQ